MVRKVEDLVDTMHAENGAGIAAPQIGVSDAVFVAYGSGSNPRYPYKPKFPLTVFINPAITVVDKEPIDLFEGCLSVPGMRGHVRRACRVKVNAVDVDGVPFELTAEGHAAGTMQHEYDHLVATLFPDVLVPRSEGGQGLMCQAAFEEHYKDAFFVAAEEINTKYPKALQFVNQSS